MVNLWSFGATELASHRTLANLADGGEFVLNRPGIPFNIINDGYVGKVHREGGFVYGIRVTDDALRKLAYLEAFDFVVYSSPYARMLVDRATNGKRRDKLFYVDDAVDTPSLCLQRNDLPQTKLLSYCNPENLSEELFRFDVTIYTKGIEHPMVREWKLERVGEYNWFDEAIILHKAPQEDKYRLKSLNRLVQSFYLGLDVTTNYEMYFDSEEIEADFKLRMTADKGGLWRITDTRVLFLKHFSHERLRAEYRALRDRFQRDG